MNNPRWYWRELICESWFFGLRTWKLIFRIVDPIYGAYFGQTFDGKFRSKFLIDQKIQSMEFFHRSEKSIEKVHRWKKNRSKKLIDKKNRSIQKSIDQINQSIESYHRKNQKAVAIILSIVYSIIDKLLLTMFSIHAYTPQQYLNTLIK